MDSLLDSIRGPACVMSSCVVCKQATQCFKCRIIDLEKANEFLRTELRYWKKESNKQLILKDDYSQYFDIDNKYLPIKYIGDIIEYHFLTITFDPSKFGLFNNHQDEQNYIFKTVRHCIKKEAIRQLTGCFEYQQNGTTHAHMIIRSDLNDRDIEDLLRPYYTDNEKNRYAIKCLPAKFPNVEQYIMKESNEYYRYDPNNGFYEDGLVCEEKLETKLPDKQPEDIQRIKKFITAYKNQISHYQALITTFEKRLNNFALKDKN